MNFFDDERKIIDFFQDSSIFETWFPTPSLGAVRIYKSIHNRKKWNEWIYNAGKSDPPPDFYSKKFGLMMEVMRVDDHTHVNEKGILVNPTNEKESKIQKEVRQKIKAAHPEIDTTRIPIFVNAITGLPSNEDHNFVFYYESFKRTVEKHISKIPLYRQNHPDKKLVFFICDESTAYVRVDDQELVRRGPVALEEFVGDPHCFFADSRFWEVFKDADIDFVVWYAPFKMLHGCKIQLPKVAVFDMKRYNFRKMIHYPPENMVSSEA